MKKIKILRIIARLNIGGPAIHVILLSEGLNKTFFDSMLICGSIGKGEGDMSYYAARKSVTPYIIPQLHRQIGIFSDILALIKIYRIICRYRPDIIHTHTAKAGTIGRLSGILYNLFHPLSVKVKLVHTFHGHVFNGYFNYLEEKIFISIERVLAFFCAKIITVSNSVKEELVSFKICKPDKIEVIALGFELDKFLAIPLKEPQRLINIGIIGRLVAVKNHYLFLEAAAKLISENPALPLKFEVIGDGELRNELQEFCRKLGIEKTVTFRGWQKDLRGIYANLDIVALTSLNEGTPVSLIEAMASGKLVVATDVGGIKDILGPEKFSYLSDKFTVMERGIIVNSFESDSFAAGLNYAINNYNTDMRIDGRRFVTMSFAKERLLSDIEKLYRLTTT